MIIFAKAREASVANKPILGCPQVIWVRHKKKEPKKIVKKQNNNKKKVSTIVSFERK